MWMHALRGLVLVLAAGLASGAAGVVCLDVPLQDQTGVAAALKLDCGAFLGAHNQGHLFAGSDEAPDCMALKEQLRRGGGSDQGLLTCACISGYTDRALNAEGFYRDISWDVLLHSVHCADRCGVSYQQIVQAQAAESCGCVNVHGCRFGSRTVGAQIARARALGEISAAGLLVLPDNALLDASVVFCAQTHCHPPAPVSPRVEILCAATNIAFRWCNTCAALCPAGEAGTCVRTSTPPYCRRVCARGFFLHAATGGCVRCSGCGGDLFELRGCTDALDTVCAACPYGTFLPAGHADRRACLPCAPGQYSPRGGARCVPAPESHAPVVVVAGANCSALARAWDAGRQQCAECAPNSIGIGGARCEECPQHTTANLRGDACIECPGSHQRSLGARMCAPCPPGSEGWGCVPCLPGTVNPGALEACAPCAANTIPNAARTACVACPASQRAVQLATNATPACDFCPEGQLLGGAGECESCTQSRLAQCPSPLVMDACRGDFHPRMSGRACACGCRPCPFAADAQLAGGVRALAGRCALGCASGERLLPGTAGMVGRCEKDSAVDALAGGGLFFFSPSDSTDLTLHSYADVLVDASGQYHLEPAIAPHIARANHLQLPENWCQGGSLVPCAAGSGGAAKSLHEVAPHAAVRAQYWPYRAELGCFFQCQSVSVFVVSHETGGAVCQSDGLGR